MSRASAQATASDAVAVLLVAGLGCALALRWAISGSVGAQSATGGLVFAGCLAALCAAAGLPVPRNLRGSALAGTAGGLLLAGAALLRSGVPLTPSGPTSAFLPWLAVAATVACAEEALLRGTLFALLEQVHGERAAVLLTAVLFAGLHVPLYGWHALPLDCAVGLLLGMLRVLTASWAAPAVAHVLADAAGWWLR